MAMRSQKAVQLVQEKANARAVRRMAKGFRLDIDPLITAIAGAKSAAGMRRAMGPTLLAKMGTDAVSEALGVETLKAAASGVASGTPGETSKRRNVEKPKGGPRRDSRSGG